MLFRLVATVAMVSMLALTVAVHAQVPSPAADPRLAFEVASVKENKSDDTMTVGRIPPQGGTLSITNADLRTIIREAYEIPGNLERFLLVAPPDSKLIRARRTPQDFLTSPRFDIEAKASGDTTPGQRRAMLRTLLEQRFTLRAHRETRPLPAYALTVARQGRLGPSLRPSSADCAAWRLDRAKNPGIQPPQSVDGRPLCLSEYTFGATMGLQSAGTMTSLVSMLQAHVDRVLLDATGLSGTYEWAITFAGGTGNGDAPSIYTAVQEQLGLKLEPRTAPYEVLVIDSVEMPTEN